MCIYVLCISIRSSLLPAMDNLVIWRNIQEHIEFNPFVYMSLSTISPNAYAAFTRYRSWKNISTTTTDSPFATWIKRINRYCEMDFYWITTLWTAHEQIERLTDQVIKHIIRDRKLNPEKYDIYIAELYHLSKNKDVYSHYFNFTDPMSNPILADGLRDPLFARPAAVAMPFIFPYLSPELKADKDLVLQVIRRSPDMYAYVEDDLKSDKELAYEVLRWSPYKIMYSSLKVRSDRDVMSLAMDINPLLFHYASEDLRMEDEHIIKCLEKDERIFIDIPLPQRQKYRFIAIALETFCRRNSGIPDSDLDHRSEIFIRLLKNENFSLAGVKRNMMTRYLVDNRDFVERVANADIVQLQFASRRLLEDRVLIQRLSAKNPAALGYASRELQTDRDFVLDLVSTYPKVFEHTNLEFQYDPRVILRVLSIDNSVLSPEVFKAWKSANDSLLHDPCFADASDNTRFRMIERKMAAKLETAIENYENTLQPDSIPLSARNIRIYERLSANEAFVNASARVKIAMIEKELAKVQGSERLKLAAPEAGELISRRPSIQHYPGALSDDPEVDKVRASPPRRGVRLATVTRWELAISFILCIFAMKSLLELFIGNHTLQIVLLLPMIVLIGAVIAILVYFVGIEFFVCIGNFLLEVY